MLKKTQAILCIGGPTGAGKSAAALFLAEACRNLHPGIKGAAVVNADSRQVYADFPLITAQPGPQDTARCRHLLYGFLPTREKISAGRYVQLARQTLEELWAEDTLPVLTGGSGLYFRSLLSGIAEIPRVQPELHEKWQTLCAEKGSEELHALLRRSDPEYAAKIHPNDRQRITRALEVWEATGKTFSWWHQNALPAPAYQPLFLGVGLGLPELEPLLKRRIEEMLAAGALDEARRAMRNCPDAASPGWSGIGCAEIFQYLHGRLSLEACKGTWFQNTRAYAKRQLTWFRAQRNLLWHRPGEHESMLDRVRDWLAGLRPDKRQS